MRTEEPTAKQTPSTSTTSNPPSTSQRVIPRWLSKYLKSNPVSVAWQSSVVVGSLILAVHFIHIGFFPELNWQSSLALVGIVALTGLVIFALVCLWLIFPAFTWVIVLENVGTDEKVAGAAAAAGGEPAPAVQPAGTGSAATIDSTPIAEKVQDAKADQEQQEPVWWRLSLLFGLPVVLIWALVIGLILLVGWEEVQTSRFMLAGLLITIAMACGAFLYFLLRDEHPLGVRYGRISRWRYIAAMLAGSIVFVAPISLTYFLTYTRYNTAPEKTLIFVGAACLGFVYNLAVLRRWLVSSTRRAALAGLLDVIPFGLFLFLSLTMVTGTWALIPEFTAYLYGVGNLEGVTLVLDKDGCAIARALRLDTAQEDGAESCRVPRVKILNRLGTTYYLESNSGDRFTLPGTTVISYELPAAYPVDIHLDLKQENGNFTFCQVSLLNIQPEEAANIQAVVEFRDRGDRLVGHYRMYFVRDSENQSQPAGVNLKPPLAVTSTTWQVTLWRSGRKVPYNLK